MENPDELELPFPEEIRGKLFSSNDQLKFGDDIIINGQLDTTPDMVRMEEYPEENTMPKSKPINGFEFGTSQEEDVVAVNTTATTSRKSAEYEEKKDDVIVLDATPSADTGRNINKRQRPSNEDANAANTNDKSNKALRQLTLKDVL